MLKFVAALLLLATGWVQAAQITVKTDHSPVAVDETFQLIFSLDADAEGEPDFSALNQDFDVLGTTQSHNISIVNGKTSRTIQYRVTVLPKHAGQLTVPPIHFGQDLSPELRLQVQDTAASKSPGATTKTVFLEVAVDQGKPFVQQQVILTVRIFSRIQWREASLSEPQFEGGEVLMKKLGDDRRYQKQRDGKTWQVIERRYALFPQKSGELKMQMLSLNLRIPAERQNRRSPFSGFNDPFMDDFFSRRSYRNKIVRSQGLSLDVQPVPTAFDGQRWLIAKDIQLEENWSVQPDQLKAGEPATRTLAIIADGVTLGQLPELALPQVDGLRVYPDEPITREQTTEKGLLSTSSRKFAIIPTQAGRYELPAVELKWWNSKIGREQTARIPPRELVVTGTAVASIQQKSAAMPAKPVTIDHPVQKEATAPAQQAGISAGQQKSAAINNGLIAGNILLLLLWLGTLYLLFKKKAAPKEASAEKMPVVRVDLAMAKKQLHQALASGSAAKIREALLQIAKGLWPDHPPTSLESMADRVQPSLAKELNALSRHLYADPSAKWNAEIIEKEVSTIQMQEATHVPTKTALKPLYPST